MPNLDKEDVQKWMNRIKVSEEWRKPHEEKWKKIIGYQKNVYFDTEEDDQISVNLVHPFVRVVIPAIYSKNPDVMVLPRNRQAVKPAETMQKWLRYLMKEIGLKGEMKLCILDALLCGHGWMKTGFQTDFEEIQEKTKGPKTIIQRTRDAIVKAGGAILGFPNQKAESTYSIEVNEKIVSERPWVRRASPFDIFVPAFSKRPDELAWIAERFIRPLIDVKNNPRFINRENLKPSADAFKLLRGRDDSGEGLPKTLTTIDEDMQYVIYYEIYDGRTDEMFVIAEENELPLLEPEDNPYDMIDSRFNYDMLRFNEVTDEFYPLSDIEPWEPQIHELNATRTQVMRHRKRYNRRYVYKEEAFTEEGLTALKRGEDGVMVPTTEDDLSGAILPVVDPSLPPETYANEKFIREDITNISGVSDYQRGSAQAGAKTATEASIVESQSRFRTEERLDVVSTFANSICVKLAQISQAFLSQEQVFPVLGEDALSWVQIGDRRQIKGDFIYDVVFGSSAPINRDVDREQFKEFYVTAANDPIYNPYKVRLEYLKKMDVKNPEDWLNPTIAEFMRRQELMAALGASSPGGGLYAGGNRRPGTSESRVPSSASERQKITKGARRPGGIGGGALVR